MDSFIDYRLCFHSLFDITGRAALIVPESYGEVYQNAIPPIKSDLVSGKETIQGLALNFIGVTAVRELIEGLFSDLVRLAFGVGTSTSPFVRKKAILCVLKIYKKYTDKFLDITSWLDPLRNLLRTGGQATKHLSLMTATVAMMLS